MDMLYKMYVSDYSRNLSYRGLCHGFLILASVIVLGICAEIQSKEYYHIARDMKKTESGMKPDMTAGTLGDEFILPYTSGILTGRSTEMYLPVMTDGMPVIERVVTSLTVEDVRNSVKISDEKMPGTDAAHADITIDPSRPVEKVEPGHTETSGDGLGFTDISEVPGNADGTDESVSDITVPGEDVSDSGNPESGAVMLTVTIYGNGGTPECITDTYPIDSFGVDHLTVPTRPGKHFDGWYEDAGCTVPFAGEVKDEETLILYAGWRELPGMTCDDNGYILSWDASVSHGLLILPDYEECTGITKDALAGLSNEVTEVFVPANISYIEPGAFDRLSSLMYIEVMSGNPSYYSKEGILYNHDGTVAAYPKGRGEEK